MWGNLQNKRRSPVVVNGAIVGENGNELPNTRSGWGGLSCIFSVVTARLSLLSCVSDPQTNDADRFWVSSELSRVSEINHLVINDSMRYAILMLVWSNFQSLMKSTKVADETMFREGNGVEIPPSRWNQLASIGIIVMSRFSSLSCLLTLKAMLSGLSLGVK